MPTQALSVTAGSARGCSARWTSSSPRWDTSPTNHCSLLPAPSLPSNPLPLLIHWKQMQRVTIIRQVQIAGWCNGWCLPLNNGLLPYQQAGRAPRWRHLQALQHWHIIHYPIAQTGLTEAPGTAQVLTPHQCKSGAPVFLRRQHGKSLCVRRNSVVVQLCFGRTGME